MLDVFFLVKLQKKKKTFTTFLCTESTITNQVTHFIENIFLNIPSYLKGLLIFIKFHLQGKKRDKHIQRRRMHDYSNKINFHIQAFIEEKKHHISTK